MQLSKKVEEALNQQINAEMYSAYLYQAMAAWLASKDLVGMAHWMSHQAKEELGHAFKIYNYMEERGVMPQLMAIAAPKTQWKSPDAVFKEALKHEEYVTSLIAALIELCRKEKDYATEILMNWYMTEQVEEESSAARNVYLLELAVKDNPVTLHLLDKEFAARS